MRLKLLVAYVGTRYCGWQIQEKPSPPPTIQGELEAVFSLLAVCAVYGYFCADTFSGCFNVTFVGLLHLTCHGIISVGHIQRPLHCNFIAHIVYLKYL